MNSPTRATIVVGVDGSTSALHAALWGRRRGRPAAPSAAAGLRQQRVRLRAHRWAPPPSLWLRTETVRSR
jgi:hypothetical protein